MTTHLNQLLAIAKGTRANASQRLTKAYQLLSKGDPWTGITRTYRPKADDGERLPGEQKLVQVRAADVVHDIRPDLERMLDVQASLDHTNQEARADVVINGQTILTSLPASTLLFLEKQLVDLHTFFSKMPTLDIADKWVFSSTAGAFESMPLETVRTKKVPRNHVLAEATDKHPAQVQMFTEDVTEGYWTTTKYSGAMDGNDLRRLLDRILQLQNAVKQARERANETEVLDRQIGKPIFDFILADVFD